MTETLAVISIDYKNGKARLIVSNPETGVAVSPIRLSGIDVVELSARFPGIEVTGT